MPVPILNTGNPVNRGHPLAKGLVNWWKPLPHNWGGSVLYDVVGSVNATKTGTGPVWNGEQAIGGSRSISGWTSSYYYSTSKTVAITGDYSVVIWWKLTSTSTYSFALTGPGLAIHGVNTGGASFYLRTRDSGSVFQPTISGVTIGAWQQFVCSAKASSTSYCYLDNITSSSFSEGSGTFSIGTLGNYSSWPFLGSIAEIKIYNRALTQADVLALRQEALTGYPNLLNWSTPKAWSFGSAVQVSSVAKTRYSRYSRSMRPYGDFSDKTSSPLGVAYLLLEDGSNALFENNEEILLESSAYPNLSVNINSATSDLQFVASLVSPGVTVGVLSSLSPLLAEASPVSPVAATPVTLTLPAVPAEALPVTPVAATSSTLTLPVVPAEASLVPLVGTTGVNVEPASLAAASSPQAVVVSTGVNAEPSALSGVVELVTPEPLTGNAITLPASAVSVSLLTPTVATSVTVVTTPVIVAAEIKIPSTSNANEVSPVPMVIAGQLTDCEIIVAAVIATTPVTAGVTPVPAEITTSVIVSLLSTEAMAALGETTSTSGNVTTVSPLAAYAYAADPGVTTANVASLSPLDVSVTVVGPEAITGNTVAASAIEVTASVIVPATTVGNVALPVPLVLLASPVEPDAVTGNVVTYNPLTVAASAVEPDVSVDGGIITGALTATALPANLVVITGNNLFPVSIAATAGYVAITASHGNTLLPQPLEVGSSVTTVSLVTGVAIGPLPLEAATAVVPVVAGFDVTTALSAQAAVADFVTLEVFSDDQAYLLPLVSHGLLLGIGGLVQGPDGIFAHDDCEVDSVNPIDPRLLIDPYIPLPPDPIGDCARDLAFIPPLPPLPPLPPEDFCPVITVNEASSIYIDPLASEPSMTFSVEQAENCSFDFLINIALPSPVLAGCPTFTMSNVEAYTDSTLSEPFLDFTIVQAEDDCAFDVNFVLGVPIFDGDSFFQSINITNIDGINIFFNSITNNYGGNIYGGPTINNTINLGMNLTLPVKQISVVSDILCDIDGNLTVCYQNALVLSAGKRRCLPLECPPTGCCITECETLGIEVIPAICGITEAYLYRDSTTGEWYGLTTGTDDVVVEFRVYCLAGHTFMDVYCNGHYFEYLSGELYGSCPEDSTTYFAEHEETFLGLLTPFYVANSNSETCECLFAAEEYVVGVTALCGDSSSILACCDPFRPVPYNLVEIEITASVGPACTPLNFSGELEYRDPNWIGSFEPTPDEPGMVMPDVTVVTQLTCRSGVGYFLLVVAHLASGAVVTFEVPLEEITSDGHQFLVGNVSLATVIAGCEGYFEVSIAYPCYEEYEIDPEYCAVCEEIDCIITLEGCDPVSCTLTKIEGGELIWEVSGVPMGLCACDGELVSIWDITLTCDVGNWSLLFSSPVGDPVITDIEILRTNPVQFIASGTMDCAGPVAFSMEFTEAVC